MHILYITNKSIYPQSRLNILSKVSTLGKGSGCNFFYSLGRAVSVRKTIIVAGKSFKSRRFALCRCLAVYDLIMTVAQTGAVTLADTRVVCPWILKSAGKVKSPYSASLV